MCNCTFFRLLLIFKHREAMGVLNTTDKSKNKQTKKNQLIAPFNDSTSYLVLKKRDPVGLCASGNVASLPPSLITSSWMTGAITNPEMATERKSSREGEEEIKETGK